MTFEWDNPERVTAEVERLLKRQEIAFRVVPERAVRRGTFELLRLVQDTVPKRTTALVKSIGATVRRLGRDLVEGKVGTHLEYAKYLEEGTGIYGPKGQPITIVPRHKKALYWGAKNAAGKPIMAKRVVIQGMKPRAPFAKAMATFLPRYVQIIRQELAKEAS